MRDIQVQWKDVKMDMYKFFTDLRKLQDPFENRVDLTASEYWKERGENEWLEFVELTITDYWLDCGNYSKLSREFSIPRATLTKMVKDTIKKYNKI